MTMQITIAFPINAVFIFPITVFCLWFLLELFTNKKPIYFPGLVITICLGIQFHYSIITYALTVIFLIFYFKIQIRTKALISALLLAGICFLPYAIHKKIMHIPNNWGEVSTFEKTESLDLQELLNIIFIQN